MWTIGFFHLIEGITTSMNQIDPLDALREAIAKPTVPTPRDPSRAWIYVLAILGMSFLGVSAIVAITIGRPESDNTAVIVSIVGFLTPTLAAILAILKVQDVHVLINSRMTALLAITAKASEAEGKLAGRLEEQQATATTAIAAAAAGAAAGVAAAGAVAATPTPETPKDHQILSMSLIGVALAGTALAAIHPVSVALLVCLVMLIPALVAVALLKRVHDLYALVEQRTQWK